MSPMDLVSFHDLSSQQLGVFSRAQVIDLGWSRAAIRHRVERGEWTIVHPGVYGLAGHADSWHRRMWAAHLHAGPDSVLCANSAARIHGSRKSNADCVELIVGGNRGTAPSEVDWYRLIDLIDEDIVTVDGLPPVTGPARTVIDMAVHSSPMRLRHLVEDLVAGRSTTVAEIGVVLDRIRRQGKPGVRKLARVLDELGPGDDIPRSQLERLGDEMIALAGVPAPIHEHPLPNAVGRTGFVDRCWPDAKLILELDGRKWHNRIQQQLHDADRRMEAAAEGYLTQAILWEHATSDRHRCAQLLRTIHADRIALHS